MSFLSSAARKEDKTSPEEELESTYKSLFPKIGRDFVHRDDFIRMVNQLLRALDVNIEIDLTDDSEARVVAKRYSEELDNPEDPTEYKDLV